ncbi:PH domain-containing protein [Promicromonospora citrea]|uniref:Membrane protein n=1 Tax=Promicromonospora citrea TaxID=43677 RepID=A0A8H9GLL1_9MICO|nr:PH domain-containing protein [Promicromonospora citrea]NNH50831.1 PH domain-containing protein [Promicromonospora citrea]GGM35665.1 membrane protein [Promicromonospora citrea]
MREEHLAEGETIVMQLRTHPKKIVKPVLLLLVLVAVLVAVWVLPLPVDAVVLWFATAVLVLLGIVAAAGPFLRWRTTRYVITNQRVALRTGILTQTGRDIPLYRINNVTFEKQLSDRFFGCGTLVISDGTDQPGMVLDDVPDVEQVQRTLQDLVRQGQQLSDD